MNTSALISFLNKLAAKGLISTKANDKIQDFLDYNTNFFGKLFMVLVAICGSLFAAAAIFELISHNWDDLPKHVRGAMSVIPLLIALYFYYIALFKYKNSVVWIEASSMFLFLMIGASISLVSNTYQLDGDFNKFMWVWLLSSVPLFYIARASGIAILYLGMAFWFIYPEIRFFWGFGVERNENYLLFWMFFFLLVPHFLMILNYKSRKQGMRAIYLGWIIAFCLYLALPAAFAGGWLFWGLAILLAFMLVGNRFYAKNLTVFGKPFQFMALWAIFHSLLSVSNKDGLKYLFELENLSYLDELEPTAMKHYILGLIVVIGLTVLAFIYIRKKSVIHKSITYLPVLILFVMILHYINQWYAFDMTWLGRVAINFYVLGFGLAAMILGNREKNIAALFYGLFLICALLWARYFDMDISFWLKGIIFLFVSGLFFFINYIFAEEVDTSLGHPTNTPAEDKVEITNEEE